MTKAQPSDYPSLKKQAEAYFAEGSYARAYELYKQASEMTLPDDETRWIRFRMADTLWRSEAASATADTTRLEEAEENLLEMVEVEREEDKDTLWAEAQESLGDFYWMRRDYRNWGSGWEHYQQALDWWAGSADIESARNRYLQIVWKAVQPVWAEPYYFYGYHGNWVPLDILENVLKIAQSENDKTHAHYLIAMTLRNNYGDERTILRTTEEFEAAIAGGKRTDWYDDALFHYAQYLTNAGRPVRTEDGQYRREPDFPRALELYRRILAEFPAGASRYRDDAQRAIDTITKPQLAVAVSNIFLPGSEIEFQARWRNIKDITFTLSQIDLISVSLAGSDSSGDWIRTLKRGKVVKTWTKGTGDTGKHLPGQEPVRLEEKLETGAYLLEAESAGQKAREIVLVTDAALVIKTSVGRVLLYACDARNGSPLPSASVRLWQRYYTANHWAWRSYEGKTNDDGILVFPVDSTDPGREFFAVATAAQNRQAFTLGHSYHSRSSAETWRIYAYTDRPAYRPGEMMQWKFTARRYDGAIYTTPSNEVVEYELYDPRGSKVKEGRATLNQFGSAWDSMPLTETMPLGEYRVTFHSEARKSQIGSAPLFRLEEYKLPEFKVSIRTPETDGKKKAFRTGDTVEVEVQADYYFGGPVSNAEVEVLVYQNPFYMWWYPHRDYSWYYEDLYRPHQYSYGYGQVVHRETLTTDATGKVTVRFDSPRNSNQDLEYRIEARVTDASRREITASDSVRVTRQSYYVFANPQHYLFRPQDKVAVDIKALDANRSPVSVEGTVKITRDFWFEVWLNPKGREVKGEELKKFQEKVFPPPGEENQWKLKFRGYQHDEILTRAVQTDANGEAEVNFTPERDGYYRIAWNSDDAGIPVKAETTVWVATTATTELGYRHGGVEIIVDRDTFRTGQKAPVMLAASTNDRYVLFSVEGEELYNYRLVHLTGSVKLIELDVDDSFVPNVFLNAAMVTDRQLFTDQKQVVVPPEDHFLKVEVTADRQEYQPQEDGTLTIETKTQDGKPVAAEVALSLVDESVFYIQQDYAGDPRQFYFGQKRSQRVGTQSSFQYRSYQKLEKKRDQAASGEFGGIEGGIPGGVLDGVAGGRLAEDESVMVAKAIPQQALRQAAPQPAAEVAEELAIVTGESPALPAGEEAVQVRSDFRSTVLWQPDVVTDANGTATIRVKYPDSLTSWKATARVATTGSEFGIAEATTRTKKPLIVRLQAPRFFLARDTVTVSAVVNNNTDEPMTVDPKLVAEGLQITSKLTGPLQVPANGEARADWSINVVEPGSAKLTVTARGGKYADAMEKTYPVYEHGIEKFIARSGKIRADEAVVQINLPKERRPGSTTLAVNLTPSMAVTMLDALPYLIQYPYGCTEQTMSRFLPSVIVAKTLRDLKVTGFESRLYGGIEPASADETHPNGKQDLTKLNDMVQAGLNRLYNFQHGDGGWGWWKEGDSDPWMTAYVVWGLTLAKDSGTELRSDVLRKGADFLNTHLVEAEEMPDLQAWMLHGLSVYRQSARESATEYQETALENLWKQRDRMNAYTRALFALSAQAMGDSAKAQTLARNLENGAKIDSSPDTSVLLPGGQSHASVQATAHWGTDGFYWRWSEGPVETTAFVLRALLAIDPQHRLVEPAANWLIKNRRGAQWNNTRDTAITILTLNEYLRRSGELNADTEYELIVNGRSLAKQRITPADVFRAPSRFEAPADSIQDGINDIRIRRLSGDSPLYFAVQATYFSLEEPVTAAGSELFVKRQYYRLVGKPTLLKGYVYDRVLMEGGGTIESGERVEVVVTIETKNDYEYLVFEDLKPAGLEAVEVRSGQPLYASELKSKGVQHRHAQKAQDNADPQARTSIRPIPVPPADPDYTGRSRWIYQELRDRKVALFADRLPQGVWEIRYTLRAETPGRFHALPLLGSAMYVPEIRANSEEIRIEVIE